MTFRGSGSPTRTTEAVTPEAGCALRVRGLTRRFGALCALDGVTLDVEAGSIHGIIGPNGSGKTTLFNCITGLLKPDAGRVFLDDGDITGAAAKDIARMGVRRTFQGGSLVGVMTVLENVMTGDALGIGRSAAEAFFRTPCAEPLSEGRLRADALHALGRVGMEADADKWASELAWAERQLVQIARALIARPRLLLLDEPASGMGSQETDRVEEVVRDVRRHGTTLIVVSHDMSLVSVLCDAVTVLNYGKKIAEGRPDVVRGDSRVREAYLGVQ